MDEIIRGTTPTITFSFSSVRPSDISAAYLTISCLGGTALVERELDSATVSSSSISWTLTQEETLAFQKGSGKLQSRFLDTEGNAFKSVIVNTQISDVLCEEVID